MSRFDDIPGARSGRGADFSGSSYDSPGWKRAQARGEGFVENAQDRRMEFLPVLTMSF